MIRALYLRARSALKNRVFFSQLLLVLFTVCLIPLAALSSRLVFTQKQALLDNERKETQAIADSVARRFDDCMTSISLIQYEFQSKVVLSERMLSAKVSAEMEALKVIGYFRSTSKMLSNCGFIQLSDKRSVYVADGKYDLSVFCRSFLNCREDDLLRLLSRLDAPAFLPWDAKRGGVVYLIPDPVQKKYASARCGVYILSRSDIQSALQSFLSDNCWLYRVENRDGEVIYQEENAVAARFAQGESTAVVDGVNYYRTHAYSDTGLKVYVCRAETELANALSDMNNSLLLLIAAVSLITFLIAVIAARRIYSPIGSAMQGIAPEERDQSASSEITAMYSAYRRQKDMKLQLQSQLESQQKVMIDRIYRCLLNGKKLTNQEFDMLHWAKAPFFVAACDLADIAPDANAVYPDTGLGKIRRVGMLTDGYNAFICYASAADRAKRQALLKSFASSLGEGGVRLGVSGVYSELKDFYTAYLESTIALRAGDQTEVCYYADIDRAGDAPLPRTNYDTVQLIQMARQGKNEMLGSLERAYDAILSRKSPPGVQLYDEFELAEYYRGILRKVDSGIGQEAFRAVFAREHPLERRQALEELIRETLSSRKIAVETERKQMAYDMIAYMESKFCDSDFGLDRFAERFDISVSAASRLFSDITGENFKKRLVALRLEQAKFLLCTGAYPIAEVARRSGFSSASYFIQVFKNTQGMTPSAYRKQDRSNPAAG